MKVRDLMTREVEIAHPGDSVHDAARQMARRDAGALPVGRNDTLVGMITDRDIAIRVVAADKNPATTKIREVMTPEISWCFDDEEAEAVARKMRNEKLRRLAVLNREKRLVGIVSLGDLAREVDAALSGAALHGIAQPGGEHSQTARAGDHVARR